MAGANHGSTLALMGKSMLGYVQKLLFSHVATVGAAVLTDLEYGSSFLLRLNREWLERSNDGSLDGLWTFSLGGDSVGAERRCRSSGRRTNAGSDNTVRISGANLNYTIIDASHDEHGQPVVTALAPKRRVPHLVLRGYSHFGGASGIVGWVDPAEDRAIGALRDALTVATPTAYPHVQPKWEPSYGGLDAAKRIIARNRTGVRTTPARSTRPSSSPSGTRADGRSAIASSPSSIRRARRSAERDGAVNPATAAAHVAAANAVSSAIIAHSPIQNDDESGSYSFYIDYDTVRADEPAQVPRRGGSYRRNGLRFGRWDFTQPTALPHAIAPNEVTYVGADDEARRRPDVRCVQLRSGARPHNELEDDAAPAGGSDSSGGREGPAN